MCLDAPAGAAQCLSTRRWPQQLAAEALDCSRLIIAMMDEYLLAGPDGALSPPPASAHFSCRGFGEREIRWTDQCRSAEAFAHQAREFLDARSGRPRRLRSAARGCRRHRSVPARVGRRRRPYRLQPARLGARQQRAASSNSPSRRGATISPPFPTSGRSTKCPPMASPSASRPSRRCRPRRHDHLGRRQTAGLQQADPGEAYDPSWPATIVVECRSAEIHADRHAAGE